MVYEICYEREASIGASRPRDAKTMCLTHFSFRMELGSKDNKVWEENKKYTTNYASYISSRILKELFLYNFIIISNIFLFFYF